MLCAHLGVLCILGAIMFPAIHSLGYEKCKWANENCHTNDDCCSARCRKLHEGTDPRCADSPMKYPCFASYHCEDGLECGISNSCCAPFWGVCRNQTDCCDKTHFCREEDGFQYRMCLVGATYHVFISQPLLISIVVYWIWTELARTRQVI